MSEFKLTLNLKRNLHAIYRETWSASSTESEVSRNVYKDSPSSDTHSREVLVGPVTVASNTAAGYVWQCMSIRIKVVTFPTCRELTRPELLKLFLCIFFIKSLQSLMANVK